MPPRLKERYSEPGYSSGSSPGYSLEELYRDVIAAYCGLNRKDFLFQMKRSDCVNGPGRITLLVNQEKGGVAHSKVEEVLQLLGWSHEKSEQVVGIKTVTQLVDSQTGRPPVFNIEFPPHVEGLGETAPQTILWALRQLHHLQGGPQAVLPEEILGEPLKETEEERKARVDSYKAKVNIFGLQHIVSKASMAGRSARLEFTEEHQSLWTFVSSSDTVHYREEDALNMLGWKLRSDVAKYSPAAQWEKIRGTYQQAICGKKGHMDFSPFFDFVVSAFLEARIAKIKVREAVAADQRVGQEAGWLQTWLQQNTQQVFNSLHIRYQLVDGDVSVVVSQQGGGEDALQALRGALESLDIFAQVALDGESEIVFSKASFQQLLLLIFPGREEFNIAPALTVKQASDQFGLAKVLHENAQLPDLSSWLPLSGMAEESAAVSQQLAQVLAEKPAVLRGDLSAVLKGSHNKDAVLFLVERLRQLVLRPERLQFLATAYAVCDQDPDMLVRNAALCLLTTLIEKAQGESDAFLSCLLDWQHQADFVIGFANAWGDNEARGTAFYAGGRSSFGFNPHFSDELLSEPVRKGFFRGLYHARFENFPSNTPLPIPACLDSLKTVVAAEELAGQKASAAGLFKSTRSTGVRPGAGPGTAPGAAKGFGSSG